MSRQLSEKQKDALKVYQKLIELLTFAHEKQVTQLFDGAQVDTAIELALITIKALDMDRKQVEAVVCFRNGY